MPLKTHRDDNPTMNMTPMIDVVFQLIIFFMVGTKFAELERKIGLEVPAVAQTGALTPAPTRRVVNVYRDGHLTLDREPLTLKDLTNRLASARSQYKDLGVLIRGDAGTSFQHVADVLAACKAAGVADLGISVRIAARERDAVGGRN